MTPILMKISWVAGIWILFNICLKKKMCRNKAIWISRGPVYANEQTKKNM